MLGVGDNEVDRAAGARVIISSLLGKGGSMEEGVLFAHQDILLYMDGDLKGLAPDLICCKSKKFALIRFFATCPVTREMK